MEPKRKFYDKFKTELEISTINGTNGMPFYKYLLHYLKKLIPESKEDLVEESKNPSLTIFTIWGF